MGKIFNWVAKSDVTLKTILSVGTLILMFIPVWIYIFAQWMLGPQDFWENMAILVVAGIFLNTVQLILAIAGVVVLFVIWTA